MLGLHLQQLNNTVLLQIVCVLSCEELVYQGLLVLS